MKRLASRIASLFGRRPRRHVPPPFSLGFHGDSHLLSFVDGITRELKAFIETGTNVGSTARYVAKTYPEIAVYSCEPDPQAFKAASENLRGYRNARVYPMKSPDFLYHIHGEQPQLKGLMNLYYLDAHGYGFEWPLREELEFITARMDRAVVIVDDFKVPGMPQFRYGSYAGRECCLEYIRPSLSPRRRYWLCYPRYTEHTSPHHPLTGYVIIVFGNESIVASVRNSEAFNLSAVESA